MRIRTAAAPRPAASRPITSRLSRRVRRLEVSPTVAMSARASALRAQGRRILDFSVGEPDQPTPPRIRAAASAALEAGRTRYAPAAGLPELRAAVTARYREDFGVRFEPAEVAITIGGKQALYLVCQALLDPGDEVIVPSPHWPTFSEAVRLAGGKPVVAPTREEEGFRVTAALVQRVLSSRTRALVVNTPSNPTGAVIEPDELRRIGVLARRHGFTMLYDDTYARLGFGPSDDAVLQELKDTLGDGLAIIGTASKSYCMTGWRIGWLLSGRALVDACAALISHSTQCPATFAQVGAVEALTGPQDVVRELAEEYRRRRDEFHRQIAAVPGITCVSPAGGFYLFPNVRAYLTGKVRSSLDLAGRLLDEEGIAVVPGEGFDSPGYLRVSFARPIEELREGANGIARFLRRIREE